MKDILEKVCEKKHSKRISGTAPLALAAFATTLALEVLGRRSFLEGLDFMAQYPFFFIFNFFIVLATLAISLLFSRKWAVLVLFCAVWLSLGVANCTLLGFRSSPLSAIDFFLLKSVRSIIGIYLSPWQLVLIFLSFLAALALVFLAFWKAPRTRSDKPLAAALMLFCVFVVFALRAVSVSSGMTVGFFTGTRQSYESYGFAYCFTASIVDRGIDKPEQYSPQTVEEILHTIGAFDETQANFRPNIIFVQLESFFDTNYVEDISFSENPVPVFTALKGGYPNGALAVPTLGAGTVNSEFEILTGMSIEFFGAGEYPYQTVLKEMSCESIAFNLKSIGYAAHAIHNHDGAFYSRNIVYENLGFDTFTPKEYMSDFETNLLGWGDDSVLTGEILKAMESTQQRDFVFAVSVQAHGKYPREDIGQQTPISVFGIDDTQLQIAYEYYISQLYETDEFIGELVSALSEVKEPTIAVFYGDHLPNFSFDEDDIAQESLYMTEYLIWANFETGADDCDLYAYQLAAHVLSLCGIDEGVVTKLHQGFSDSEYYLQTLEILEYDIFFGKAEGYTALGAFESNALQMGSVPIAVSGAADTPDGLWVFGKGFTPWSIAELDGKIVETLMLDDETLILPGVEAEDFQTLAILQLGDDGTELGRTLLP